MSNQAPESANHDDELVDEAGRESFPASDPPAYSPGGSDVPVEWSRPARAVRSAGDDGQPRSNILPGMPEQRSLVSRCCGGSSVARWGLLGAATVAGVAVGSLLAGGYVGRR